jgi:hypothetical protein
MKRFLYDFDRHDLSRYIQEKGLPPYRAGQIASWSDRGVASLDEMTICPWRCASSCGGFHLDGLELAEKLASGLDDTPSIFSAWPTEISSRAC